MIEEKMIGIDGSMRNGTDNLGETIMALTTALRKEGNGVMIGEPGNERREGEVGRLDTIMIVVTVHIDLMRDLRGRGTHLTAAVGGGLVLQCLQHVVLVLITLHQNGAARQDPHDVDRFPNHPLAALHQAILINHHPHAG
jgi:hypothetical protein